MWKLKAILSEDFTERNWGGKVLDSKQYYVKNVLKKGKNIFCEFEKATDGKNSRWAWSGAGTVFIVRAVACHK